MEDKVFATVSDFCTKNKLPLIFNRILVHKYYEDYNKIVNDYTIKEKNPPSQDILKGFEATLLSEMTLNSNAKLAEDELQNYTKKEINKYKQEVSIKNFWMNVLSGVVATIIYTLLLLLFFYLGKSQIHSWLNDLNDNDKIENQQPSK
ncbi:hypothetical protein [Empedobacter brevis]|uniref:hypothetical protein n=1 Tax=Empedobacter brevis TaxID=247 RepID=UPI0028AE1D38|nr:hypothetical protein [Empedobacter brevis]